MKEKINEAAKKVGFNESTLRRAAKALKVKKKRQKDDGRWTWELPTALSLEEPLDQVNNLSNLVNEVKPVENQ